MEHISFPIQKRVPYGFFSTFAEVFNEESCYQLVIRQNCVLRIDLLLGMTPSWENLYPTAHAQVIVLEEYKIDLVDKGFMRRYNSS